MQNHFISLNVFYDTFSYTQIYLLKKREMETFWEAAFCFISTRCIFHECGQTWVRGGKCAGERSDRKFLWIPNAVCTEKKESDFYKAAESLSFLPQFTSFCVNPCFPESLQQRLRVKLHIHVKYSRVKQPELS